MVWRALGPGTWRSASGWPGSWAPSEPAQGGHRQGSHHQEQAEHEGQRTWLIGYVRSSPCQQRLRHPKLGRALG